MLSSTVIPKGTAVEKTSLGLTRRIYGSNLPGYTVGRFDSGRGEVAVYSDGSSPANGLLFATRPPTYTGLSFTPHIRGKRPNVLRAAQPRIFFYSPCSEKQFRCPNYFSKPYYLTPADPETLLAVWQHGDTATFRPARRTGPA